MKKVFISYGFVPFFFFLPLCFLFLGCIESSEKKDAENIKTENISEPDEFAKLILVNGLMMNHLFLENHLCDDCEDKQMFKYSKMLKAKFINSYKKDGVDFDDLKAHDFSEIKCDVSSKVKNKYIFSCKGKWIVLDKKGKIFESTFIDDRIGILVVDGILKFCPRSCSQDLWD